MSLDRLPDCRAPRQKERSTSAFSHPSSFAGTWPYDLSCGPVAIAAITGWPMLQAAFEDALPNFNVITARLGW